MFCTCRLGEFFSQEAKRLQKYMYVAFSERVVVADTQNSYKSIVILTYFGLGAVAENVGVSDPKVSDVVRTLIQVESSDINTVVSVGVRTLIQVESSDINICGVRL